MSDVSAVALEVFEPLFDSAHAALTFAYRFSGQQYPLTIMAKIMGGILGSGKGLVGLDGAAQAGMICLLVKELPQLPRDSIDARYADQQDRRFKEAIDRMAMHPSLAPAGISNRLERQALVARYFGVSVNVGEVAERVGVDRRTVGNHQRTIRDKLRALEAHAFDEITNLMAERGLIS